MSQTETIVGIAGRDFTRNGVKTHAGRVWNGHRIEGMLFNSRMANAIADDENPATRGAWSYTDGPWDAERNLREFIAALPTYRAHGLDAVCLNLQGGSPQGYSWHQPWVICGFRADGSLKPEWADRLDRVIGAADACGMIVMVGCFYVRQTRHLESEQAAIRAVSETVDWLAARGARNVLLEIGNEVDLDGFAHDIIHADRCHELIVHAQRRSEGRFDTPAGRLLVSTSLRGRGSVPKPNLLDVADFALLHGNHMPHPDSIRLQVLRTLTSPAYRGQPVLYNEDDHFDFDKPDYNMLAAIGAGAGWGYFDYRMTGDRFEDGYQSLPVDWGITSDRKRGFFNKLKQVVGG